MIAPAGIPSSGMMRYALSPMVAYQYLATPENDWESLFHHYIPHWRVVRDHTAAQSFFEGLFAGESDAVGCMDSSYLNLECLCLGSLFRDDLPVGATPQTVGGIRTLRLLPTCKSYLWRWQHKGRGSLGPLFKNSALWFGFAFPVFLHTMNGLHTFFP